MKKYRIITKCKPREKCFREYEVTKYFIVQERYLWIFWNPILETFSEDRAVSYLRALRECENTKKWKHDVTSSINRTGYDIYQKEIDNLPL